MARDDPLYSLELLAKEAQQVWTKKKNKTTKTPNHYLVWVPDQDVYRIEDGGELFAVVDDDSTIIRMLNEKGQVFSAIKSRCHELDRSGKVFVCPRVDMILCRGNTETDLFVGDNLLPLIRSANNA